MRLTRAATAALFAVLVPAAAHAHGAGGGMDLSGLIAVSALAASAAFYLNALRRGAAIGRRHAAAFAAGWGCLAGALLPPLDTAAASSFAFHMVQHELLMVVAPPLLVLGRPFAALAATVPRPVLWIAAWPLRWPPLAAWSVHAAALWIWHIPRFFNASLASEGVHTFQHASFFLSALLFWWTVLRRVGTGTAALYLLTTIIHSGALAALLTFARSPLYLDTPLAEQQLGGLIMWVPAAYGLLWAGLAAVNRLMEKYP